MMHGQKNTFLLGIPDTNTIVTVALFLLSTLI